MLFMHSLTADDIASFTIRCMDPRPNVTLPVKNQEEFKNEAGHFILQMNSLDPQEKGRMTDYFKNMWIELGVPINVKAEKETTTYYGDDIEDIQFIPQKNQTPLVIKDSSEKDELQKRLDQEL